MSRKYLATELDLSKMEHETKEGRKSQCSSQLQGKE